jgi:hypothetical protein
VTDSGMMKEMAIAAAAQQRFILPPLLDDETAND